MITEGRFHQLRSEPPTLWGTIGVIFTMTAIAVFGAYALLEGLERQVFVEQARMAKHFYDLALSGDTTPPAPPTGLHPNYGEPSDRRLHFFTDTSVPTRQTTSGMGYWERKKQRGR